MENAMWNGLKYTAVDVAESYELEKRIRKASGRRELRCPDPDCPNPTLHYCHGEIKDAYFAHFTNCACDYANFDKENTPLMRQVKRVLYDSFTSRGFNVQLDAKILPRHYTHLLFVMPNGKNIAVELGTQRTTANIIDCLSEQYKNIGIDVKWIVISEFQTPVKENETFFIKRYLLNESSKRDILILNWDGNEITQYIVDPDQYFYEGENLHPKNYLDMYSETSSLANLIFEGEELSIKGFHSRYNEWLIKKRKAFEKRVAQYEQELRQQGDRRKQRQAEIEKTFGKITSQDKIRLNSSVEICVSTCGGSRSTEMSYEARRESILPLIEQQEKQAIDQTGARWIRCESCGAIETTDKFWTFGGANRVNKGNCYKCKKDNLI